VVENISREVGHSYAGQMPIHMLDIVISSLVYFKSQIFSFVLPEKAKDTI